MSTEFDHYLNDVFRRENIRYYAAMPFEACHVIRPGLVRKLTFEPRTVILFLIPYYFTETENISRYASGGDYHYYVNNFFSLNTPFLQIHSHGYRYAGFCDHSPIDERHAAAAAGLGIIGDNGLLINQHYGSFTFIAEWLTSAPPELFGFTEPREIGVCEHCGACARACPGKVLPGTSRRKCLSAVTQKKGELTEDEKRLIRENGTAWGCDACQTVCPHNRKIIDEHLCTPVEWFHRSHIPCMTTDILDRMPDEEFLLRPYSFRGREVLARNLKLIGY
ncbi:MAG: epoxyqueuosine reductase [Clostridia bacterium]|nr:epoxyqueuosine reductase [Clostridia bacterium]